MNAPNFAASYPRVGVTAEYDKDPRAGQHFSLFVC
jgi:hypothetical protein